MYLIHLVKDKEQWQALQTDHVYWGSKKCECFVDSENIGF
jgi:hypothetical protein